MKYVFVCVIQVPIFPSSRSFRLIFKEVSMIVEFKELILDLSICFKNLTTARLDNLNKISNNSQKFIKTMAKQFENTCC